MARDFKKYQDDPSLCPVHQIIIARANCANLALEYPVPKDRQPPEAEKIWAMHKEAWDRLDALETYHEARRTAIQSLAMHHPAGKEMSVAWKVYSQALYDAAVEGSLTGTSLDQACDAICTPGLDVNVADDIFRALAETQNPQVIMELARRLPEKVDEGSLPVGCLEVLTGDDWELIKSTHKIDILYRLNKLQWRWVFQGSHGLMPVSQSRPSKSCFRVAWEAFAIDAYVWPNGRYCMPLGESQAARLKEYKSWGDGTDLSPRQKEHVVSKLKYPEPHI